METPWVVMQYLPWFDFAAVPMAERNCSRPHVLSYVHFSYQSINYWWYFPPLSSLFWSPRSLLTLLAVRVWYCLGFVSRRCQAGKTGDAIHALALQCLHIFWPLQPGHLSLNACNEVTGHYPFWLIDLGMTNFSTIQYVAVYLPNDICMDGVVFSHSFCPF